MTQSGNSSSSFSSSSTRQSVSARRMGLSARDRAVEVELTVGGEPWCCDSFHVPFRRPVSLCVWHLASGNYADAANWPGLVRIGIGRGHLLPALLCHLPGQSAASAVVHAPHTCPCTSTFMSFVSVSRISYLLQRLRQPSSSFSPPPLPRLVSSLNTHTLAAHTGQPAPALMSSRPHEGICCARCGTVNPLLLLAPGSCSCLLASVLAEAATLLHPQLIASPLARLLCHTSGCKLWHISNT